MATVRSKHNASLNTFVSVALHNLTSLPEFTRLSHKFLALPAYQHRKGITLSNNNNNNNFIASIAHDT